MRLDYRFTLKNLRHEFFHWKMNLVAQVQTRSKIVTSDFYCFKFRLLPFLRGDVERSETERFK